MECLECANFSFFVASRALISERVASFYWLLCFRGHDYIPLSSVAQHHESGDNTLSSIIYRGSVTDGGLRDQWRIRDEKHFVSHWKSSEMFKRQAKSNFRLSSLDQWTWDVQDDTNFAQE